MILRLVMASWLDFMALPVFFSGMQRKSPNCATLKKVIATPQINALEFVSDTSQWHIFFEGWKPPFHPFHPFNVGILGVFFDSIKTIQKMERCPVCRSETSMLSGFRIFDDYSSNNHLLSKMDEH